MYTTWTHPAVGWHGTAPHCPAGISCRVVFPKVLALVLVHHVRCQSLKSFMRMARRVGSRPVRWRYHSWEMGPKGQGGDNEQADLFRFMCSWSWEQACALFCNFAPWYAGGQYIGKRRREALSKLHFPEVRGLAASRFLALALFQFFLAPHSCLSVCCGRPDNKLQSAHSFVHIYIYIYLFIYIYICIYTCLYTYCIMKCI